MSRSKSLLHKWFVVLIATGYLYAGYSAFYLSIQQGISAALVSGIVHLLFLIWSEPSY